MKANAFIQPVLFIVAGVLLLVTAFILPPNSYYVTLLTFMMLYAVLSLSWSIFSGSTGYISLAVAAFYGVGIYAAAYSGTKLPFPVIVILGGIVSAALAALVGAITLRLRGIYFTIFTFGLVVLVSEIISWIEGTFNHTRGRFLLYPGVDVNLMSYYYMLALFIVLLFVAYYIRRSKYGLALRSIGQNEEAAEHMGVNTTLMKVLTFTLSSFFMGAAGAIIAFRSSYTDPGTAFALTYSFYPVLMAIFGGMGYLYGPIIGGVIFYYLNDRLSSYTTYYLLFFGLVMVLSITFLPNGILGIIDKLIRRSKRGTVKADAPAGRN